MSTEEWISISQASRFAEASEDTVRRWVDRGWVASQRLPQHKNMRLVNQADLLRFLNGRNQETR